MQNKSCGQCQHFEKTNSINFGTCKVPLPAWASSITSPNISPWDQLAERCPHFQQIEEDK